MCDKILEIDCDSVAPFDRETKEYIEDEICFGRCDLIKYAGFERPFGWHISNLVIYDKPKELSEFEKPCVPKKCHYYEECGGVDGGCIFSHHIRPPKSWCYVEELSNETNL